MEVRVRHYMTVYSITSCESPQFDKELPPLDMSLLHHQRCVCVSACEERGEREESQVTFLKIYGSRQNERIVTSSLVLQSEE